MSRLKLATYSQLHIQVFQSTLNGRNNVIGQWIILYIYGPQPKHLKDLTPVYHKQCNENPELQDIIL